MNAYRVWNDPADKEFAHQLAEIKKPLSEFSKSVHGDQILCEALKSYKKESEKDGSFPKLSDEIQLYVDASIEEYTGRGCGRSQELRQEIASLEAKIREVQGEIAGKKHPNPEFETLELHERELKAIPKEILARLNKIKDKAGYYKVDLVNNLTSINRYLESSDVRKKIEYNLGN